MLRLQNSDSKKVRKGAILVVVSIPLFALGGLVDLDFFFTRQITEKVTFLALNT